MVKDALDAKPSTEVVIQGAGKVPMTLVNQTPKGVQTILDMFRERIKDALPGTITVERMIQISTQLITRTPAIQECTTPSIIGAIFQCATMGLDLTPALGQCAIVPFFNGKTKQKEAQFQIMYRGLIQLARRSGEIKSLSANVVYEKDSFEYELGLEPKLIHKPYMEEDKGQLKYAYAVWLFKDGGFYFDVMNRVEILAVKSRSQAVQAGQKFKFDTPWDTDEAEMWKKTVLKRSSKYVPISVTEIANVIVRDEIVTRPEQYGAKGEFDLLDIPVQPIDGKLVEGKEITRPTPADALEEAQKGKKACSKCGQTGKPLSMSKDQLVCEECIT